MISLSRASLAAAAAAATGDDDDVDDVRWTVCRRSSSPSTSVASRAAVCGAYNTRVNQSTHWSTTFGVWTAAKIYLSSVSTSQ